MSDEIILEEMIEISKVILTDQNLGLVTQIRKILRERLQVEIIIMLQN
jgi:hypothetical protein